MFLYHYFERAIGAFSNLSDLPVNEAEKVLEKIKNDRPSSQAAQRDVDYMKRRINYENKKIYLLKYRIIKNVYMVFFCAQYF